MPLTPEQRAAFNAGPALADIPDTGVIAPVPTQQAAAPEEAPRETGGGFGELFGKIGGELAGGFRGVTNQQTRDVLGKAGQIAFSGEEALNAIGDVTGLDERLGTEHLGTSAFEQIERIPVLGQPARFVADVASSPINLATAGAGGFAGRLVAGAGFKGARLIAAGIEPVTAGGFGTRLAAETGLEVSAAGGAEAARRAGLPAPVQLAAGLGGGFVGLRAAAGRTASQAIFTRTAEQQLADIGNSQQRIIGFLRTAGDVRKDQDALTTLALGKKSGAFADAVKANRAAGMTSEQSVLQARSLLGGELPKVTFDAPRAKMGAHEVQELFGDIDEHFIAMNRSFELDNTHTALAKVLDGVPPNLSEQALLEAVFGPEFVTAVRQLPGARSTRELVLDLMNLPRTVAASLDMSAPFRQGALLIGRPREFFGAMAPMVRGAFSEKQATQFDAARRSRPLAELSEESGTFFHDIGVGGSMTAREENYASRFARAIPGIRASERAFATFLNHLRANVFDNFAMARMKALGVESLDDIPDAARAQFERDMKSQADWINIATGRSSVRGQKAADRLLELNTINFSPRLLLSRAQLFDPRTYMNATPAVRRAMVRDIVSFVGFGMTSLGMLHLAGEAGLIPKTTIELNPLSSDFGKGKVGNVRFDPWAGFQPIARYTAQLITERRKTASGDIVPGNRAVTIGRFAQSKLAPAPGALVDFLRGETFLGEEFEDSEFLDEQAANRLMPLFISDLVEAIDASGSVKGGMSGVPAFFGFGVTAFESTPDRRDRHAREEFEVNSYDQLSPLQKQQLEVKFADEFTGEFSLERIRIEQESRDEEQNLMLLAGSHGLSGRQISESIADLNVRRGTLVEGAAETLLPEQAEEDKSVRSRLFEAMQAATVGFGIIDFEQRDLIEEQFRADLTPEETEELDRDGRDVHAPEVQWYFDDRTLLREAGYWKLQNDAFAAQLASVQAFDPNITTYFELFAAARSGADPTTSAVLGRLLARIDKTTQRDRKRMRNMQPELDAALKRLYGDEPLVTLLSE